MNGSQAALPYGRRSNSAWRWWDEQAISMDVGEVCACLIVFRESK